MSDTFLISSRVAYRGCFRSSLLSSSTFAKIVLNRSYNSMTASKCTTGKLLNPSNCCGDDADGGGDDGDGDAAADVLPAIATGCAVNDDDGGGGGGGGDDDSFNSSFGVAAAAAGTAAAHLLVNVFSIMPVMMDNRTRSGWSVCSKCCRNNLITSPALLSGNNFCTSPLKVAIAAAALFVWTFLYYTPATLTHTLTEYLFAASSQHSCTQQLRARVNPFTFFLYVRHVEDMRTLFFFIIFFASLFLCR